MTINAVYYASCAREIGVIINVNQTKITILSLDGTIKEINRFDVIYLAQYPIGEMPIHKVINASDYDGVEVKTIFGDNIVDLVSGWPIDFSKEKISKFVNRPILIFL